MKEVFWTGAHTTYRHLYHIVIIQKYLRKVLRGSLVRRLMELFYECAKMNKWFIHELEVMPDHVHMLIQLPNTVTVPQAVMHLKGGSARIIRREFPELEEFLWGDRLWQDGYFSETVGRANETVMRAYIKSQWERAN